MNILTIILMIVITFLGFPIGLIIAKFTKEELKQGKFLFKLIILVCFVAIIITSVFMKNEVLFFLICSFVFIILIALASLIKAGK